MKVKTGDNMKKAKAFMLIGLLGLSATASAYVGPGAGLTLIGSLIGMVVAVLMALGIILFWPVRALIRRIRGKRSATATENRESTDGQETSPKPASGND